MKRKLYKVKVSTELVVMAANKAEADELAKSNAVNEIGYYGECETKMIKHLSDIPANWRDVIPYSPESLNQENRKCSEIFTDIHGEDMGDEDLEAIVQLQRESQSARVKIKAVEPIVEEKPEEEVKPETRPDPKPRDLDWTETKSGRPLPPLRFNIPGK